jgi:IclR family acetate operon transcriptional repressor
VKPVGHEPGTGQASGVRAVDRALAILQVVADSHEGTTLAEVARQLSLSPSTAHRLLTTLQERGFVRFERRTGRWLVGRSALDVGAGYAATRDIVALAQPFMHQASALCGETINLGLLEDGHVTFLYRVEPRTRRSYVPESRVRIPAYGSSIGKALLSILSEREVEPCLRQDILVPLTPHTLVSQNALRQEFETIRRDGYAIDNQENTLGLRCLAAAISDEYRRPIAALSMAAPIDRLKLQQVAQLGGMIASLAGEITTAWSGRPIGRETRNARSPP